jgi:ribosomal-protein-alanine N-acetyltransferase
MLRLPQMRDYEAWYSLRRASKDFLRPFEPKWTELDLTRRVFSMRVRRARQEAEEGTDYTFFIFVGEGRQAELVGGITLSNIRRRAAQFVNLGYWMGEVHAGKGIMTEAVGVTLPFIFETLDLHRVHAAFLPTNMASRRVLEKNGFVEEGFAERYLQINGRWEDHVLMGLTEERWSLARLSPRHWVA